MTHSLTVRQRNSAELKAVLGNARKLVNTLVAVVCDMRTSLALASGSLWTIVFFVGESVVTLCLPSPEVRH